MSEISLFEISWEVCNKVGGIHTVLGSKLKSATNFTNNYIVFGPYKNTEEFTKEQHPEEFNSTIFEMEKLGVIMHYGKWNTHNESVNCILVELKGFEDNANEIKGKLWEYFNIDSLGTSWFDFDEVTVWSWACAMICEKLANIYSNRKTIVHAHEWISSGATFYLEMRKQQEVNNPIINKIKTVFTTHATMLGRAYYGTFNKILDAKELNERVGLDVAKELGVLTKCQCEVQALTRANYATCVSDMLNQEIKELYGIQRVITTENGFEIELSFDDCIREFVEKHSITTKEILNYFKPYYPIKKNSRIGIISGRFEILAKGYDITFKALGELNEELKNQERSRNIIILAPIIAGEFEKTEHQNELNELSECNFAPLSEYNIDASHPLMELCTQNGLLNRKEDKIKIILIPNLISNDRKVFNHNYYELLQSCDFSMYPSGYEPWGYTPHESIAYGVVTLTSNTAGFGRYWLKNQINNSVVKSVTSTEFREKVDEIKKYIKEEYYKNAKVQYREKKYALEYSRELQWNLLFEKYQKIYEE